MRSPFITIIIVEYWPDYKMLQLGYSSRWYSQGGYFPTTSAVWMQIGHKALRRLP